MSTEGVYEGEEPILQILAIKNFDFNGSNDRFRLILSDGKNLLSFAMLAPQLNDMAKELSDFAIIRIKEYRLAKIGPNAGEITDK